MLDRIPEIDPENVEGKEKIEIATTKQSKAKWYCIMIAGAILLSTVTGALCWKLSGDRAREQAAAERAAYEQQVQQEKDAIRIEHMENFNYARTNAYRWVTDAWNRTLAEQYADVVFYGDSLTAGGAWGEWYPYYTCINLGVVGDTVEGLNSRIKQLELLLPSKCFLMIGVNDLNYSTPVEMTLTFYEKLLDDLKALEDSIGMNSYVLSVLPVREGEIAYPATNAQIRELNVGIAALAEERDMTFVALHEHFADEAGMLKAEYSYDGLHLNELGYYQWQELLIPYVDE